MSTVRLRDVCAGAPQILAWLEEHGLSADEIALDESSGPFIEGDQMSFYVFRKDGQGHRYVDESTGQAAAEARTITLRRPPPDLFCTDGAQFSATIPAETDLRALPALSAASE